MDGYMNEWIREWMDGWMDCDCIICMLCIQYNLLCYHAFHYCCSIIIHYHASFLFTTGLFNVPTVSTTTSTHPVMQCYLL